MAKLRVPDSPVLAKLALATAQTASRCHAMSSPTPTPRASMSPPASGSSPLCCEVIVAPKLRFSSS